jgi:dihydropteroate synthase
MRGEISREWQGALSSAARRTRVMGIVNVTPDSFSDGGADASPAGAVARRLKLLEAGADGIEVGGESTRPGAKPVAAGEEMKRILPVVERLVARLRVPLSVDTSKASVAQAAVGAGASMINDVTGLKDPAMARVIARAGVPVIVMHMRGTPRTMQRAPRYHDVVAEVRTFLTDARRRAEQAGIAREHILLDPGLGFGKTVAHNLLLLRHLDTLVALGQPVVIGPSRKSFIGRVLVAEVEERLAGTLACVALAAQHQAHIVRVHDVKATVQFLRMWRAIADAAGCEHRPRRHRAPSPARCAA